MKEYAEQMIDGVVVAARWWLDDTGEQTFQSVALQLAGTYDQWATYALPFSVALLVAAVTLPPVLIHLWSDLRRGR